MYKSEYKLCPSFAYMNTFPCPPSLLSCLLELCRTNPQKKTVLSAPKLNQYTYLLFHLLTWGYKGADNLATLECGVLFTQGLTISSSILWTLQLAQIMWRKTVET